MEALNELGPALEELIHELGTLTTSGASYGSTDIVLTNYIFWLLVSSVILVVLMLVSVKKLRLVPANRLSNGVEALADMVRTSVVGEMLGPDGVRRHFPLIATIFFFILINNFVGLIPGCKPGTGTMGVTVALAVVSFVAFNTAGIKSQGLGHYLLSFSPKGLPPGINVLVWVIEAFSSVLRIFTLAVRLFANMYAGHIILGVFAILTSLFVEQAIATASVATALPSVAWMALLIALYMLEVLVAVVQAYVFTVLTTVYISLAEHAH